MSRTHTSAVGIAPILPNPLPKGRRGRRGELQALSNLLITICVYVGSDPTLSATSIVSPFWPDASVEESTLNLGFAG